MATGDQTVGIPGKIPDPGDKRVWRLYDRRGKATADVMTLPEEDLRTKERAVLHHPTEHGTRRVLQQDDISEIEPLLADIIVDGEQVYDVSPIDEMRRQREEDLERLDPGVKRLMYPHIYHVSLSDELWQMKQNLIRTMREGNGPAGITVGK